MYKAMNGRGLPTDFGRTATVYPGKGRQEGDDECIVRKPGDTRPISLKNSDAKVIDSLADWAISPVVQAISTPVQRGFIKGRQIIDNVVDLDTVSRIYSIQCTDKANVHKEPWPDIPCPIEHVPVLVLFDQEAAFPSLSHDWLFAVLKNLIFPKAFAPLSRPSTWELLLGAAARRA